MSWRPHGKARVDPDRPEAFGVCDRCGFVHNLVDLRYELDWRGIRVDRTGFRVCDSCWSEPAPFLRTIVLPPDPVPVADPRFVNYDETRENVRITENESERVTEADSERIIE